MITMKNAPGGQSGKRFRVGCFLFFTGIVSLGACKKAQESKIEAQLPVEDHFVYNLTRGVYPNKVYFNFRTGKEVELPQGDNWDMGFDHAQMLINGGDMPNPKREGNAKAAIANVSYADLKEIPNLSILKQDVGKKEDFALGYRNGGKSWYYMTDELFYLPYTNKCVFLQTADGKGFVKMEVISFYRDNPSFKGQSYASLSHREGFYTLRYQYIEKGQRFK